MKILFVTNAEDFLPQGLNEVEICEFMKLHKSMKHFDIEVISIVKTREI